VSAGKLGAWFLLMIISYVLVALVNRPQAMHPGLSEAKRPPHTIAGRSCVGSR
jgi:hypothetical protein